MSARLPSIFSRLWHQVREIPDVKVNLLRASELGSYARAVIPGWVLPLGRIGGWLVFPALTQSFKTEVLGFKAPPSGTKFAFEKEAVGENVEMTEGSVK